MRVLILWLLALPAAGQTLINFVGFELGSTTGSEHHNTNPSNFSMVADPVKNGSYAARGTVTGSGVSYYHIGTYTNTGAVASTNITGTIAAGFWFRYATKATVNHEPVARIARVNGVKWELDLNSDGTLFLSTDGTTTTRCGGANSATALLADTWYFLEFKGGHGNGAACEVRINGASEIAGTQNASTEATTNVSVGKGSNRNGNSVDYYFDDVYLATDFIANAMNAKVVRLKPTGLGTYAEWSGAYTTVSETVSDGDTSYLVSTAAGQRTTFDLESCASKSISGTILGVKSWFRLRGDGGTATLNLRLRSGGADNDLSNLSMGTGYDPRGQVYLTDPATSVAWTTSALDAAEIGVVENASSGYRARITTASAMVYFVEAGEPSTSKLFTVVVQ
jgi:hypothetical protein